MTDQELGWVVGLLEGEGTFVISLKNIIIACHMTDCAPCCQANTQYARELRNRNMA